MPFFARLRPTSLPLPLNVIVSIPAAFIIDHSHFAMSSATTNPNPPGTAARIVSPPNVPPLPPPPPHRDTTAPAVPGENARPVIDSNAAPSNGGTAPSNDGTAPSNGEADRPVAPAEDPDPEYPSTLFCAISQLPPLRPVYFMDNGPSVFDYVTIYRHIAHRGDGRAKNYVFHPLTRQRMRRDLALQQVTDAPREIQERCFRRREFLGVNPRDPPPLNAEDEERFRRTVRSVQAAFGIVVENVDAVSFS